MKRMLLIAAMLMLISTQAGAWEGETPLTQGQKDYIEGKHQSGYGERELTIETEDGKKIVVIIKEKN